MQEFPVPHHAPDHSVPDPELRLSVSSRPGGQRGRVIVEVVGEVDSSTAPVVEACLYSQATRPAVRELVVDLGQVTSLGAAGVTALAQVQRECRERGARLVIRRAGLRPLQLPGGADTSAIDPPEVERPQTRGPRTAARPPRRPRRSPADRQPQSSR